MILSSFQSIAQPKVMLHFAAGDAWATPADVLLCGRLRSFDGGDRILASASQKLPVDQIAQMGNVVGQLSAHRVVGCPWPIVVSLAKKHRRTDVRANRWAKGTKHHDNIVGAYLSALMAAFQVALPDASRFLITPFTWRHVPLFYRSMLTAITSVCESMMPRPYAIDSGTFTIVSKQPTRQLINDAIDELPYFRNDADRSEPQPPKWRRVG